MARLASQMLGGYFPTPPKTLAILTAAFKASSSTPKGEVACLVDPFAGRGEAIAALVDALPGAGGYSGGHRVVTAELEDERSKVCVERTRYRYGGRWTHHHGDAFHLELDVGDEDGATVLYLNPPYDTDADFGRLEERALVRFTDALAPGGLLLYLIPRTAIAASAETLAKRYENLRWYRLPDGEYEAFSQVLCLATKRYHDLDASPEADTLRALAKETADLPPLEEGLLLHVPTRKRAGFDRVSMHALDAEVLKMYRPWFQTARGRADSTVQTVFPAPGTPMAARAFKSAVPPRPSHIAYAMASGVFNGARVAPNETFQGLPELLVKGQFARKYKVKEEVFNADGELKGTVQVQQPELTITVLRLDTHALVTLAPTAETSSTPSVTEGFTIGDLFTRYGDGLLGALLAQCKVQYNPQHDSFDIPEMDRPLFAAQKHTVRALTALLGGPNVPMAKRVGTAGILLGELGCLRGDTPIFDPVAGDTLTVAERHRKAELFHVWALGPRGPVIAAAMPPKRYPPSAMLRVTCEDGSAIVVTPAHRFWTGSEWVTASALASTSARTPLGSSSAAALSTRAQGGTRWTQTVPGSRGGYRNGPSSDDAQLPPGPGTFQGPVPSPSDARARNPRDSRVGGLEPGPGRSRTCQSSALHSRTGFDSQGADPAGVPSPPRRELHSMCASDSIPARAPRSRGLGASHTAPGLELDVLLSTVDGPCDLLPTEGGGLVLNLTRPVPGVQPTAIVRVEPVEAAPYYDFHVPVFNNYWAAGLWHHNCGKTSVALGVQRALGRVPMLVMCPPHLLESWRIEAAKVAKDVEVQFLRTPQDVDRFCESKGPVLGVMSREGAKLGSHVVGVQGGCPRCGAALPPGDLAARRARCKAPIRAPQNAEARVFDAMLREGYAWLSDANMTVAAEYMGASHARLARVARRYRVTSDTPDAASELRKAERKRLRRHLRRADLRAMLAEALWSAFDRGDYGLKGARRNRVSAASLAQSVFFAVNDPAWARAVLRELYDRAKGSDSAHVRSTIRDLVFWCTKSPEDAADFDVWAKVAWKPSYGTVASAKSAWEGLKSPNGGPLSWEGYRLTPEGKLGRVRDGAMVTVGSAAAATTMLDALRTRGLWGDSTPCGEPLYQASPEPEGSKTRGAKHADATGGLRRIPLATYLSRKCPRDFQFLLVMDECFVAGTMVSGRPIETLRVGDVVDSWDESARLVVPRRVKRLFVSRPSALVRVRFGNGAEFVCTPGHPVLTARGWVPAGALHPGDSVRCTSRGQNETPVERALCLVPGRGRACRHGHLTRSEQRPEGARGVLLPAVQEGPHGGSCFRATTSVRGEFSQETQGVGGPLPGLRHPNDSLWARGGVCAQGGLRVLFSSLHGAGDGRCDWSGDGHHHQTERTVLLRTHEGEQPDARPRGASEGRSYASGEGLETTYAGGERPSTTCPAATIGRRFGVADGGGSTHGDPGVSTLSLQAGHREYHLEGVYRGGRRGARCPDGTSGGCAQADVPGGTWVVCVEVLEPGGDGRFGGVCPDGLVYNLEVEGTHTYTAAGVVVHNCHELSTVGSAQEKAAHRLTALRRPTLLLTGSWMNGYADSLFSHQWALFQDFREEFPRTARTSFVDRYGFREKYVPVSSKPVVSERGAVSDRELKDQEKDRGVAPGVMPDFLLRHLLPHCVTLQRSDFAEELPGCTEESVPLHAGDELHAEHVEFMRKLLETIKGDRFNADLAGALFGQLNEAPSQLDRCTLDTGNTPSGDFVMRYPVRVREKFPTLDVVSATKGRPTSFLHPKEVWLLERLARERAEGRRTMVMGWHTEIFERYARLIERAFGERPPILYADKVPAAKRLEWIQKRVVDAGATELIVNPATVGTGLNNLVHFATGVFLENPACNPQIARQVKGRLDRIGQNLPVRFFWPHYAKTGQAVMLELLQRKSAIAMSVDGLDASTALQAVGVGEGYLTSISVSKALYDALIGDAYA